MGPGRPPRVGSHGAALRQAKFSKQIHCVAQEGREQAGHLASALEDLALPVLDRHVAQLGHHQPPGDVARFLPAAGRVAHRHRLVPDDKRQPLRGHALHVHSHAGLQRRLAQRREYEAVDETHLRHSQSIHDGAVVLPPVHRHVGAVHRQRELPLDEVGHRDREGHPRLQARPRLRVFVVRQQALLRRPRRGQLVHVPRLPHPRLAVLRPERQLVEHHKYREARRVVHVVGRHVHQVAGAEQHLELRLDLAQHLQKVQLQPERARHHLSQRARLRRALSQPAVAAVDRVLGHLAAALLLRHRVVQAQAPRRLQAVEQCPRLGQHLVRVLLVHPRLVPLHRVALLRPDPRRHADGRRRDVPVLAVAALQRRVRVGCPGGRLAHGEVVAQRRAPEYPSVEVAQHLAVVDAVALEPEGGTFAAFRRRGRAVRHLRRRANRLRAQPNAGACADGASRRRSGSGRPPSSQTPPSRPTTAPPLPPPRTPPPPRPRRPETRRRRCTRRRCPPRRPRRCRSRTPRPRRRPTPPRPPTRPKSRRRRRSPRRHPRRPGWSSKCWSTAALEHVQVLDGDEVDAAHRLGVVLVDQHHVEVAQPVLHALQRDDLDVVEREHEGRPLHQVHQAVRRGQNLDVGLGGHAGEGQLAVGHVEHQAGHLLQLGHELLEVGVQPALELAVAHLLERLVGVVVGAAAAVVEVVDLRAHLTVELHVHRLSLAHHDGRLEVEVEQHDELALAGLEDGVPHVSVGNVHVVHAVARVHHVAQPVVVRLQEPDDAARPVDVGAHHQVLEHDPAAGLVQLQLLLLGEHQVRVGVRLALLHLLDQLLDRAEDVLQVLGVHGPVQHLPHEYRVVLSQVGQRVHVGLGAEGVGARDLEVDTQRVGLVVVGVARGVFHGHDAERDVVPVHRQHDHLVAGVHVNLPRVKHQRRHPPAAESDPWRTSSAKRSSASCPSSPPAAALPPPPNRPPPSRAPQSRRSSSCAARAGAPSEPSFPPQKPGSDCSGRGCAAAPSISRSPRHAAAPRRHPAASGASTPAPPPAPPRRPPARRTRSPCSCSRWKSAPRCRPR
ncbi:uncharacterized protein BcabD6B2_39810 [Babesia caballi]|uniref:Uncharacterized protein n=1 Tax=Babesia caballi TaxID=5871 RepID=A0AAV4LWK0_BABCB|nr:hypothetical protein BcabD6B2_39810 [Babesia caballi]